jgi:hypothetical protein
MIANLSPPSPRIVNDLRRLHLHRRPRLRTVRNRRHCLVGKFPRHVQGCAVCLAHEFLDSGKHIRLSVDRTSL